MKQDFLQAYPSTIIPDVPVITLFPFRGTQLNLKKIRTMISNGY
jgi:hypothetical protein